MIAMKQMICNQPFKDIRTSPAEAVRKPSKPEDPLTAAVTKCRKSLACSLQVITAVHIKRGQEEHQEQRDSSGEIEHAVTLGSLRLHETLLEWRGALYA
jgi:hypothetical protein